VPKGQSKIDNPDVQATLGTIHRTKTQETKNTNPEKNNILKKFLVIVNNRFDFLPPPHTHKKERIHKKNMGGTILG
jgi:hypothetical protein